MTSEILLLPLCCRCHRKAFCDKQIRVLFSQQYQQLAASFIFVSSCPLSFAPSCRVEAASPSSLPVPPPFYTAVLAAIYHPSCLWRRPHFRTADHISFASLPEATRISQTQLSQTRATLGLFTRAYLNQTPRLSLDLPQTHNLFKVHRCRMSVSILTPPPHNFFFL